jgi:adenosylmethionine-8-amino-7-oxononanoate aminotransferase
MVAALITETVMQGMGALPPPEGYFERIRSICDRYGVLLIMDEVICGFGRTGKMFAVEHYNIKPDIMTMAKQLTGGYAPLGAAATKQKIAETIPAFLHVHTYGNHPVCCAAALATLDIIEREKLVANAAEVGKHFLRGLQDIEKRHPIVGEARGIGLWLAIEIVRDKKKKTPFPVQEDVVTELTLAARERGVIFRGRQTFVEFAPPLTISRSEVEEGLKGLDEALCEVEKKHGL